MYTIEENGIANASIVLEWVGSTTLQDFEGCEEVMWSYTVVLCTNQQVKMS